MPSVIPGNFRNPLSGSLSIVLYAIFIASCSASSGKSFSPAINGYNESAKKVYVLPKKLLEISGHVLLEGNQLVAINDEKGELLFHALDREDKIKEIKFGKKGDYEELIKLGNNYVVMESNGDLHFVQPGVDSSVQYKFSRDSKVEFESMVHYPEANQLILLTKDHRLDEEAIYAFSFDLSARTFNDTPVFKIQMREVMVHLKDFSAECKPSGAAIHPLTKKLFIVASVGKVLLQCAMNGKIESAHALNPSQFQQPEGISFASNGDMYISNEGLQGKATLMMFPYRR